jgi:hypothetical protein
MQRAAPVRLPLLRNDHCCLRAQDRLKLCVHFNDELSRHDCSNTCSATPGAMTLHLIKLCVGCDSVKDLEAWIREKRRKTRGKKTEHLHRTRMVPKRADELVDGGSLYWVIRGEVACRQRLLDVRPYVDKGGVGQCHLVLAPKVVPVKPRLFRAFQGWRYLEVKDAPPDLERAAPGAKDMPETMRRELRELGLL